MDLVGEGVAGYTAAGVPAHSSAQTWIAWATLRNACPLGVKAILHHHGPAVKDPALHDALFFQFLKALGEQAIAETVDVPRNLGKPSGFSQ